MIPSPLHPPTPSHSLNFKDCGGLTVEIVFVWCMSHAQLLARWALFAADKPYIICGLRTTQRTVNNSEDNRQLSRKLRGQRTTQKTTSTSEDNRQPRDNRQLRGQLTSQRTTDNPQNDRQPRGLTDNPKNDRQLRSAEDDRQPKERPTTRECMKTTDNSGVPTMKTTDRQPKERPTTQRSADHEDDRQPTICIRLKICTLFCVGLRRITKLNRRVKAKRWRVWN